MKLNLQEIDNIIDKDKKKKELNKTIFGSMDKIGQLIFYILSTEEKLIFLKKMTSKENFMIYLFAKDTDTFNKILYVKNIQTTHRETLQKSILPKNRK